MLIQLEGNPESYMQLFGGLKKHMRRKKEDDSMTRGAEIEFVMEYGFGGGEGRLRRTSFQSFLILKETADSCSPREDRLNFQQEGFRIDIIKYPGCKYCEKNVETSSQKILRNNKDSHCLLLVALGQCWIPELSRLHASICNYDIVLSFLQSNSFFIIV